MSESTHRSSLGTAIIYRDPSTAIDWLEKAFGFEVTMLIRDSDDNIVHSELGFGNGYIMVGNEWHEKAKSPLSVDGANTQNVHVQLTEDIDAHCERARAGGRPDCHGARGPVLRRPDVSCAGPRGAYVDIRADGEGDDTG